MLKTILNYLIVIVLLNTILCGCACIKTKSLEVTAHPQETGMWCWAASGQMVMDYLGHDVTQCVQANNRFGHTDCCGIDLCPLPTEPTCILVNGHPCACGGWPEFNRYDFDFKTTSNAALSWEDVKDQISKNQPFCITWHHNGGGGHMMVAVGYRQIGDLRFVEIIDPWSPCIGESKYITYDSYVSPSGKTHWDDYYDIEYIGGE